jgi:hypothetical protein
MKMKMPPHIAKHFTAEEVAAAESVDMEKWWRVYNLLETLPRHTVQGALTALVMESDDPLEVAYRLCNIADKVGVV